MATEFSVNETVRVKGYPDDSPNALARVIAVYPDEEKIWIANLNMPFYGTISKKVLYDAVEKLPYYRQY